MYNAARHRRVILGFFAPAVLLIVAISLYPIGYSFFLAFFETRFTDLVRFIGFENFNALASDSRLWANVRITLVYVGGTLLGAIPIGMGLALVLDNPLVRYRALFRTILIVPWAVTQIVIALLFRWLLDGVYGPVAYGFDQIGLSMPNFTGDPNWAVFTIIVANVWRSFPFVLILTLAALQTIPSELYQAAKIDGAAGFALTRFITLPLVLPTILVAGILLVVESVNMVALVFVLTGGGPLRRTEVLGIRIYDEIFRHWDLGYSAAIGVVMLAINLVFALLYVRFARNA
jgi:multiple sugar transport system permease protein